MLALYRAPLADVGTDADGAQERGAMSATRQSPPLASYRDAVTELTDTGETFGDIEEAIDEVVGLTLDQKAALWLFAFSLRDQEVQQLEARAHLAALA
jgi:hypothetical protein